jgi:hypothetical protein
MKWYLFVSVLLALPHGTSHAQDTLPAGETGQVPGVFDILNGTDPTGVDVGRVRETGTLSEPGVAVARSGRVIAVAGNDGVNPIAIGTQDQSIVVRNRGVRETGTLSEPGVAVARSGRVIAVAGNDGVNPIAVGTRGIRNGNTARNRPDIDTVAARATRTSSTAAKQNTSKQRTSPSVGSRNTPNTARTRSSGTSTAPRAKAGKRA